MDHKSPTMGLVAAIVALSILVSAGPTLVDLMDAALPVIVVGGIVAVVVRLVFVRTRRW